MKKFSRKRHIAKAITWRIIGTLDTMVLGWVLSGDIFTGLKIGGFEVITKMGFYYLHERLWYKILVFEHLKSTYRHILKSISWRIIGTLDTALIGFFVSGSFKLGLKIGVFELITKTMLYFVHERVWHRSDFGLIREKITVKENE